MTGVQTITLTTLTTTTTAAEQNPAMTFFFELKLDVLESILPGA